MKRSSLLALGFGCLLAAQGLAYKSASLRPVADLPHDYYEQLPPGEMVGTLMLGGFRGLAIDLLWLRAIGAKKRGQYYESVAVYDLISRLQPRFEQVWEYMAWDMAYNIGHQMDSQQGKWSWYKAGLEAGVRGVKQNPESFRLLKYIAWLLHHKGDLFREEIEQAEWSLLLNPVLERYDVALCIPEGQIGLTHFQLSERFYRAAVTMAHNSKQKMPAWVRRFIPLTIEMDANYLRNTGRHYQAMLRFMDCLDEWDHVLDWMEDGSDIYREADKGLTLDSFRRNGGDVSRRLQNMLLSLAKDQEIAQACRTALAAWDLPKARTFLEQADVWHQQAPGSMVRWLDEQKISIP